LAIDFAPGQNEPFCIQCKFRLTAINTAYQAGVIARWHDTDTTQRSWGLWIWNDGKIQFSISNDGTDTNVYWLASAPGLVQMNRNYHVAVERNAANKITIYLDGIAITLSQLPTGETTPGVLLIAFMIAAARIILFI